MASRLHKFQDLVTGFRQPGRDDALYSGARANNCEHRLGGYSLMDLGRQSIGCKTTTMATDAADVQEDGRYKHVSIPSTTGAPEMWFKRKQRATLVRCPACLYYSIGRTWLCLGGETGVRK